MSWLQRCLLVAVCAVVVPEVEADLGAALRRSTSQKTSSSSSAVLPLPIAPVSSIAVPLRKVVEKSIGNFYVGQVFVGQPAQEFQVVFDTSSGHVLLPHRGCTSKACLEHRRFSPWESRTAMDVNAANTPVQEGKRFSSGNVTREIGKSREGASISFTQSDLGEGVAKGVWVRDHVCLVSNGQHACTDMTALVAVKLDDVPFRAMPHDGIVGLGLHALSTGPMSNFFETMAASSNDMLPQFGISFGADGGEILFGGHDRAQISAPIQWFPVAHPEQGFWQVSLRSVRVGDVVVDACHTGCRVVIDTSTSRIGVLPAALPNLRNALSSATTPDGGCEGPSLTFDLGGMTLNLQAKDYVGADCEPRLGPLNLTEPEFAGMYILGESALRRYYAAFDWQAQRLGFAPTATVEAGLANDASADTIFM